MLTTSSFSPGYDQTEAQLTMTLSTLAYINENPLPTDTTPAIQAARMRTDINAALQNSAYPDWQNYYLNLLGATQLSATTAKLKRFALHPSVA